MSDRVRAAALLLAAAFLGAWSGDGWRIGPAWLSYLVSFQALWALGAFVAGRGLTRGRGPGRGLGVGALAGAVFGGTAIAAYYVDMWLVQGAHSAVSQLTETGGPFWVGAAVTGGAAMGVVGALTRRRAGDGRLQVPAMAWALVVVVLVAEVVFVQLFRGLFPSEAAVEVASALLLLIALVVAALGARRTGPRAFVAGAAVMLVVGPLLASAFLWVEQVLGYTTL